MAAVTDWNFHIARGLDLEIPGVPVLPDGPLARLDVESVARTGIDDVGLKPDLAVEVGDKVRAGDVLWRKRACPDMHFTAPASGVVTAINRGHKRKLVSVQIARENSAARTFQPPNVRDPDTVRPWLLETGLWTAIKTRPFGRIPDPRAEPLAVFVTAMDADPSSPDPAFVIDAYEEFFMAGLRVLTGALAHDKVIVCARPNLKTGPMPGNVRRADFSGAHAAALPGTHIHALCPVGWHGGGVGMDGHVWQVGYQDVIAMGHAALSGTLWQERVVALAGPLMETPRVVLAPCGARVSELVKGTLRPGPVRLIAGSAISGRAAYGAQDFLGPAHHLVTALKENAQAREGGTAMGGHPGAILPVPEVERAWPFDIPATPLMRALAVGDGETVRALGGLALVEEDVAALSFACPSKTEYGVLLRKVLDDVFKAEGFAAGEGDHEGP